MLNVRYPMTKVNRPDVIILRTINPDWVLISCNKETSVWIRNNFKEPEQWRVYLDSEWRIYSNRLEIHKDLLLLLQIKYKDILDRREDVN